MVEVTPQESHGLGGSLSLLLDGNWSYGGLKRDDDNGGINIISTLELSLLVHLTSFEELEDQLLLRIGALVTVLCHLCPISTSPPKLEVSTLLFTGVFQSQRLSSFAHELTSTFQ